MKSSFALLTVGLLAGCAGEFSTDLKPGSTAPADKAKPAPRPESVNKDVAPPPRNARTAAQFDTTTKAQKAQAVAAPKEGARRLGKTIGSLGDPAEPGFWLKTPLVSAPARGRVEYPASGKSVTVDLIPIDGPKTAGSRVSLAALRLSEATLTGLPELVVYVE